MTDHEDRENATDLEILRAFLTRTGVVFTEDDETTYDKEALRKANEIPSGHKRREAIDLAYKDLHKTGRRGICISEGDGPKNTGYSWFCTTVIFDEHGTLVEWGAWE